MTQEEADKRFTGSITSEAVDSEQSGIVFLDEIDKIAGKFQLDLMFREGVQRDILPIVEGSTVMTKYGPVKTDSSFLCGGISHRKTI